MGTYVASEAHDVVLVPGPEPVGQAMNEALSSIYGLNLWGATGAAPGWGGENSVGWDLGPGVNELQHYPQHNLPTARRATVATGEGDAVPGLNTIRVKMARNGI